MTNLGLWALLIICLSSVYIIAFAFEANYKKLKRAKQQKLVKKVSNDTFHGKNIANTKKNCNKSNN